MSPAGFELTIPVSERPQTHALDRAATGIGGSYPYKRKILQNYKTSVSKIFCLKTNKLYQQKDTLQVLFLLWSAITIQHFENQLLMSGFTNWNDGLMSIMLYTIMITF